MKKSAFITSIKKFFSPFIDILFPKICLSCRSKLDENSVDEVVCRNCWNNIIKTLPPFCAKCGRSLIKGSSVGSICQECTKGTLYFDRAFSPCVYDGVIKELIHEFKYKNKEHLGRILGNILVDFVKEYSLPIDMTDMIVPVPLHPVRLREREFNQAEVLCGFLSQQFCKPVLKNVLIRQKNTRTQTELTDEERFRNVKECFTVKNDYLVSGKNILLVDDVLTTGATASSAAKSLKKSGASQVLVLTLAN